MSASATLNRLRPLRRTLLSVAHQSSSTVRLRSSGVGVIGVGNMGRPMAKNLAAAGHNVFVYDANPENMSLSEEQDGTRMKPSPAEIAKCCDRIVTMLPTASHVVEVLTGENGVFKNIRPGTLILDSSTIDPTTSKKMAAAAETKSAVFMDAPVSGGVPGAVNATLTFMVGANDEKEFEAAKVLLKAMGKNIVRCGPVGSGQIVKIVNNMLLAVQMIGTAEAMNMGIRNCERGSSASCQAEGDRKRTMQNEPMSQVQTCSLTPCILAPCIAGAIARIAEEGTFERPYDGCSIPKGTIGLGMNAKALQEILSTSTSRCWSMDTYNPVPGTLEGVPSANQYQRGFLVQLITKDLGLAQDAATTSASPTPMGSLAHQIFRTMMEHGLAEKDFSVVYKFLKGQKPEDPEADDFSTGYLLRLILEIMTLEAIKYNNGKLRILDQLRLPEESVFIEIETVEDGWTVINKMQVRGAPAIAIVGCLSLAVELHTVSFQTHYDLLSWVTEKVDYLVTSRPTAVNLAKTVSNLKRKIAKWIEEESELDPEDIRRKVIYTIEDMLASDLADNQAIGMHGAEAILKYYTEDTVLINDGFRILTHCNTGSLATSGYGTALGIIRRLSEINRLSE
ncbi:unnamed protein product [Cyprideis torosa]|uniref:3-hydroxyisobutyrate dehydrogenase n=1 Tax=Cyprideis torosa TaxID=163714 RepID=A0A7R8ZSJ2_9CRUS|nr:unnamed protein product [Cyprideis torosa]CAG0896167.1 unnamed protein product [Cyprideis torosa]